MAASTGGAAMTMDHVPVNLMPVALGLGYIVVALWGRVAIHHLTSMKTSKASRFGFLGVVAFISYCLVIGRIEGAVQKAVHASFDPYQVLDLGTAQNPVDLSKTIVTEKYKEKVKYYHPSNPETGDAEKLQSVMNAFQALTDENAKRNWKTTGHPNGSLLTPIFQFAIPRWLWSRPRPGSQGQAQEQPPQPAMDEIYPFMVTVHVIMISFMILSLVQERRRITTTNKGTSAMDDLNWNLESNTVHDLDFEYLAQHVKPDMTAMEVLLLTLSAPTNLVWGARDIERIEALKIERLEKLKKPQKFNYEDLVQEDGWASDDDDENESELDVLERKRAEKEAEDKRQAAAGVKMEGVDDGVLGQLWVEKTLTTAGEWPPANLSILDGKTFEWNNGRTLQKLSAVEHPAMRRLLCFFNGRLNSQMLNSHPELVQAGIKKLIDPTYFQSSLVFRQRMSILLEAVLKIGTAFQSRRLVRTGVEASVLFKIGTKPGSEAWFRDVMMKQYGVLPQLNLTTLEVATEGEQEIASGESTQMTFEVERLHAENFLRQKLQQLQQQGIPPQVGLQAYREGWWFLVSCERLDGKAKMAPLNREDETIQKMNITDEQLSLFNKEKPENRLLATLPMMLGNISQRSFKASGSIKAPTVAGKYRFLLEIKSIEFLCADVSRSVDVQVVDAAKLTRKLKEDSGAPGEAKKEK